MIAIVKSFTINEKKIIMGVACSLKLCLVFHFSLSLAQSITLGFSSPQHGLSDGRYQLVTAIPIDYSDKEPLWLRKWSAHDRPVETSVDKGDVEYQQTGVR